MWSISKIMKQLPYPVKNSNDIEIANSNHYSPYKEDMSNSCLLNNNQIVTSYDRICVRLML